MKKNKRAAAFLAAVLICLTASSCGASDKSSDSYNGSRSMEAIGYDDAYDYEASYEAMESTSVAANGGKTTSDTVSAEEYEDKIIRTANVQITSTDAQKCYSVLLQFAKENGGSEVSVTKNHDSYEHYDYFYIYATLKIAPDKLEDFIALAEKTDKVTSSEITSDDVTQDYYDIKLRLESKKKALKSYYKLLDEAKTIEETLEIQRYITDLTADIESMEGMLRYYDAKVDLSTINLTISQQEKVHTPVEDEFHWDSLSLSDVGTLIKNGFLGVINFLWSLLLWLIIAVAALSPILLIAGVVFFFVRRYRKKHPKAAKPAAGYYPVNYAASVQQPANTDKTEQPKQ